MSSDNDLMSDEKELFAELRESFLRAIINLKGTSCEIVTYEKSTLKATFAEWNPDGTEMLVTDLKTPANFAEISAILRTSDILTVHFDKTLE